MIVKINAKGTWILIDGVAKIEHREIRENDPAIGVRADVLDYTSKPCSEDEAKAGTVEMWMTRENGELVQALAFKPVFLLNNEGRTIEKI